MRVTFGCNYLLFEGIFQLRIFLAGHSPHVTEAAAVGHPLPVTSRQVVWLFLEQFWLEFVPVLHPLQGRLAHQSRLRELLVVKPDIAVQRCFQLFA